MNVLAFQSLMCRVLSFTVKSLCPLKAQNRPVLELNPFGTSSHVQVPSFSHMLLKKTVPFSANDPFAVKKSSQRKWSTSRRARARRDDREMNKMRGWSQINSLLSNSLSWMQTTNAGQSMAERTHARAHACRHKYTHTHNHKQIGRTAPTVIDRLKRHQCV